MNTFYILAGKVVGVNDLSSIECAIPGIDTHDNLTVDQFFNYNLDQQDVHKNEFSCKVRIRIFVFFQFSVKIFFWIQRFFHSNDSLFDTLQKYSVASLLPIVFF